jgi:hypothetical protein
MGSGVGCLGIEIGIGDIITIVIAAVFGAVATGLYRDWQDSRAQKRELRGLLGLILAEVVYNQAIILNTTLDDAAANSGVQRLQTGTWDKVMDRLAQLLTDEEDLVVLTKYYGMVRLLSKSTTADTGRRKVVELLTPYEAKVKGIVKKHQSRKNQGWARLSGD